MIGVEKVYWWLFLRVFDSYCMCACIIACCQSFPNTQMHSWVSAPVFRPDRLFSTRFQLFLFISNRSHLLSIDFTHFWLSSFVFDYFYPNSSITAYFFLFLYHFRLFSFIFNHFNSFFIALTCISSLSSIMAHFRWFTITLTNLNYFQVIFTNTNLFSIVIIYIWLLLGLLIFTRCVLLISNRRFYQL